MYTLYASCTGCTKANVHMRLVTCARSRIYIYVYMYMYTYIYVYIYGHVYMCALEVEVEVETQKHSREQLRRTSIDLSYAV